MFYAEAANKYLRCVEDFLSDRFLLEVMIEIKHLNHQLLLYLVRSLKLTYTFKQVVGV
ncbi:hypothetical protein [Nostoc sp. CHAB 5715]|uniref:hypothetical protein n=1 Tax=Nostoc sp. CHAB 5715 TaxID=2780400 RepID=UPI001E608BB5|nr:hypothetical protein [Nostoc sp. CHAB 5715]MCC5622996.1 hypothetical protein [Nostoc sp. CHAB 5715]